MSLIPRVLPPDGEPAPPRPRPRAPDLSAEVQRVRPELPGDAPEHRAAVLLLLLSDAGANVDRLVRRTGYPREFVARCLRRLADNAWWVEGEACPSWGKEAPTSRDFWLDVEVALGRSLRRIGPGGVPEWAPVGGGWVKAFEYRGPHSGGAGLHNEYREIGAYDPEPEFPLPEEDGEEEPMEDPKAAAPAPAPLPPGPGVWLGKPDPDPSDGSSPAPEADFLLSEWTQAGWLR